MSQARREAREETTGWTVKSAIVNGRDVSDVPFEIRPNQSVSDVVVTLTDRAAELSRPGARCFGPSGSGIPTSSSSRPDAAFRTPGARRFPAPVRSATDGTFRFAGLPPGAYYVAALAELNQSSLSDDGFLARVAASATVVTLADGEKKAQDLILPRGGAAADVVGSVFTLGTDGPIQLSQPFAKRQNTLKACPLRWLDTRHARAG